VSFKKCDKKMLAEIMGDVRKKRNPILWRMTHKNGLNKWQREVMEVKKVLKIWLGANRTGKTELLVTIPLAEIEGIHPHQLCGWRDMPPKKDPTKKPIVWRIITAETTTGIDQNILPMLRRLCNPKSLLVEGNFDKSYHKRTKTLYFKDGCQIQLMTYTQKITSFEGVAIDGVAFDEPPPEPIYNASVMRILQTNSKMKLLIGATLTEAKPEAVAWIEDKIEEAKVNRKLRKLLYYRFVKLRENKFISESNINDALTLLSKEAGFYRMGEGDLRCNRRYPNFEPKYPWVVKPFKIPRDYTRHLGYDYHAVKESPMVFVAVTPSGRMYVYHEAQTPRHATYKEIAEIVKREKNFDAVDGVDNQFYLERGDPVTLRTSDSQSIGKTSKLTLLRQEGWYGLDIPSNWKDKQNQATILNSLFKIKRWCLKCGQPFPNKALRLCAYCGSNEHEDAPTLQIMYDKRAKTGCVNLVKEIPRVLIDTTAKTKKETFKDERQDYAQALRHIIGDSPFYYSKRKPVYSVTTSTFKHKQKIGMRYI